MDEIDEEVKQAMTVERDVAGTNTDPEDSEDDDKADRTRKVSKAFRAVKIW